MESVELRNFLTPIVVPKETIYSHFFCITEFAVEFSYIYLFVNLCLSCSIYVASLIGTSFAIAHLRSAYLNVKLGFHHQFLFIYAHRLAHYATVNISNNVFLGVFTYSPFYFGSNMLELRNDFLYISLPFLVLCSQAY